MSYDKCSLSFCIYYLIFKLLDYILTILTYLFSYETVNDKRIAHVALTGEWENALAQIERGDMQPETFNKAIEAYTRQITSELLDAAISPSFGGGEQKSVLCPKCKAAVVRLYPKVAKCTDTNCNLTVFRNISEKQLSDRQITELLGKRLHDTIFSN